MPTNVLMVECPDRRGLVHAITGILLDHGVNIVVNHEFVDASLSSFFMRTECEGVIDQSEILRQLRLALPAAALVRWSSLSPKRIVVLASMEHHCLGDILIRNAFGDLNASVAAVISNHRTLEDLTGKFGVPFHHVPHDGYSREEHEARLLEQIDCYAPDFVVLAKYMRILGAEFVGRFPARIVNIHHSFLPAFVGARPYQQAFERGVKVIGASAHFVTAALDAGPIIVQRVIPVDHTHGPRDLAQAGREAEQSALAQALKLVFEDRVFLCGNRTIIFD